MGACGRKDALSGRGGIGVRRSARMIEGEYGVPVELVDDVRAVGREPRSTSFAPGMTSAASEFGATI